jgi:subtilisin
MREYEEIIDIAIKKVFAEEVWHLTKGEEIKVAVLDTGIDTTHFDLNIQVSKDFTSSKSGAQDMHGHGTHAAGIIAARENKKGIIGIAPECLLYNCKILDDRKRGSYKSLIAGIEWCIENKIDIINMSLGSSVEPPIDVKNAIKKAYDRGIIMVAAAGNENKDICYPAKYDEVIAVSAVGERNEKADFSNYGTKNEFIARGVNVYSTYLNNSYKKSSGTSVAAPIVSGCIVLYLSYLKKNGIKKSTEEIYQDLINSCQDIGEEGKDIYYGHGMIDCRKLIKKGEV